MAKINALTPDVYNLIAAGEVVDEPVGAVKELVENSIDAGARHITIEVAGGGLEQLTVTDDGCGIEEDDVELAFAKYATSKLKSASDLFGIQSLGFRGEALSSIAAVSRIKLTTCLKGSDVGVCVTVENGIVSNKQYVSVNHGTKIEVRDLYYNTPARKKFLKSVSGERANITKFIAKFILTNPNVAVTYIADGKTVYESKGMGLDEAIFAVYGGDCLVNCIPVNYDNGNLRITGYIGTPDYSKANRNYQTLSVNGRCVVDAKISAVIQQAYSMHLMTQKFPFYILDIDVPAATVDVNIHPKKSQVRFEDLQYISGQFYRAVKAALQDYTVKMSEAIFPTMRLVNNLPPKSTKEEVASTISRMEEEGTIEIMNSGQREDVLEIERLTEEKRKKYEFEAFVEKIEREVSVANARKRMGMSVEPQEVHQEAIPLIRETPIQHTEPIDTDAYMDDFRILGIAFKTYVIVQFEDKVIFIDQHAAHERILFDKFLAGATNVMQELAFPYTFSVKDEEAAFIDENIKNILSAGIEIEPFGPNTYRITAVSKLLENTRMDKFVEYILASVEEFRLDDRKLIVEAIAKKACKAAVKAGEALDEIDIAYILRKMRENKIVQCPHGRPITAVFTKTQIEKMFKRIV